MIGEVSIGGVYVPAILLLAVGALLATGLFSQILQRLGAYRLIVHRPLVEVALFTLILGLMAFLTSSHGIRP